MLVSFDSLAAAQKERLKMAHARSAEILDAITLDLSRQPVQNATPLSNGRFLQIFRPAIAPAIELRLVYLANAEKVFIKSLDWRLI